MSKDLELALRIKADLTEGQRALDGLSNSIEKVGESAQQQESRIQAMVAASLQQKAATDALTDSTERNASATQAAGTYSRENAAAQTAAMNAYHAAERAAEKKALADQKAAEAAQAAAAAVEKEGQELGQLLGKIDPVIRKLNELDAAEDQLRSARAKNLLDGTDFDHYNAKLQEQRTRLTGTSDAMKHAGISAGQYKMAMQQLPMQITDITTSLASGMPIWLVAIQQGGQIKDSFGGVGNAASAMLSLLNPMTVALGSAAIAAGVLTAAWYQGSREAKAFNEAVILSGQASGVSASELALMAREMDAIEGTTRQAAAALALMAKGGKFTADQMRLIGEAAVALEAATGRAVGETVAEFERLAKEPVKASAELNEQYNYLTAAVYEQIAALEAQGDATGAAQLAQETYAAAISQRSDELKGKLGLLEQGWNAVKTAAAEAWDSMLDIGREKTLQEQLDELNAGPKASTKFSAFGPIGVAIDGALNARSAASAAFTDKDAERARLTAAIAQEDADAKEGARRKKIDQDSIEAQKAVATLREQSLSRAEQKEKAIAEYRANVEKIRAANPDSDLISAEKQAKDLAAIEKRYSEPASKTRTAKPKIDQELRAQEQYVAQLQRQADTLDMTAAQVRMYELEQKGLTGTLLEQATAYAALINAAEQKKQAEANAQTNAALEGEYLRSIGRESDAAMLEITQRFAAMAKSFEQTGNDAGQAWIEKLIPVEKARVQLDQLNAEIEKAFSAQQRGEQSVEAQVTAGLLTEMEGRQRIVDIHRETAAVVEQYMPALREMAAIPGPMGEQAAIALQTLETQLLRLRTTTNELQNALRDGLQNGIEQSLMGLVDGTMNLREAVTALVQSVAQAMAQLAAQQLAEQATSSIMSMFGGGTAESSATASAITAASAAGATSMGTGITTAGAAAATSMGSAIATAGAAAAQAMAAAMATSSAASGATGIAAAAFATGGHVRGPGTGTSDSIPAWLSDYEFVTRAAVVQQPGALEFLEDFNRYGMATLGKWAAPVYHSTGGLAGVPAPSMPAPGRIVQQLASPASSRAATLKNSQNFYLIDDPNRIGDVLSGPVGVEAIAIAISREPGRFRSLLGVDS